MTLPSVGAKKSMRVLGSASGWTQNAFAHAICAACGGDALLEVVFVLCSS